MLNNRSMHFLINRMNVYNYCTERRGFFGEYSMTTCTLLKKIGGEINVIGCGIFSVSIESQREIINQGHSVVNERE